MIITNSYWKFTATGCTLFLIFGLIFFSEEVIPSTVSAVSLCLTAVVPALLPFFVCARFLSALGFCEKIGKILGRPFEKLFRLPACFCGAFILGFLCGFPMGAKVCADLYQTKQCTKRQAVYGSVLCNNAGPLFIIGTLGTSLLQNTLIGKQLWAIHLTSSVITMLLFRGFMDEPNDSMVYHTNKKQKNRLLESFSQAVSDSVNTLLQVCGLIIFFNAGIQTLLCLGLPSHGLIIGGIELTSGLSHIAVTAGKNALPLCSLLLGFGGLSILLQVASVFSPLRLSIFPYMFGKIVQGSISAALTITLYSFFPIPQSVFLPTNTPFAVPIQSPHLSVISLILVGLAIVLRRKKISPDSL